MTPGEKCVPDDFPLYLGRVSLFFDTYIDIFTFEVFAECVKLVDTP